MRARRSSRIPLVLSGLVILTASVLQILSYSIPALDFLQRLELMTYDWRARKAMDKPTPVATNLAVVYIDDASLDLVNRGLSYHWPWPRVLYGQLVNALNRQGARAVAFDILMHERHAESAQTEVEIMEGVIMHADHYFATQLARWTNVVLATFGERTETRGWKALPPADLFRTNTWAVGHAYSENDEDGVLRRALAFWEDPKLGRVWHMGIVMAAKQLDLDLANAVVQPDRILLLGPGGVSREIPLDEEGFFYINWCLKWNDNRLLLDDFPRAAGLIPSGEGASSNRWQGKLVFVGSIGSGNNISDIGVTPLSQETYLMSKHWNVANSVLTGQFITPKSKALELVCVVLLGVMTCGITWKMRAPWPTLIVGFGIAALGLLSSYLFTQHRYWLPTVFPVLGGVLLPHVALVSYQLFFEQREKRHVRRVFAKVVSPDVVQELLQAERLNLGGARRRITVMFADVRGFTEMTVANQEQAEEYVHRCQMSPSEANAYFDEQAKLPLATVNEYLAVIADQIKRHNGTLDKYIGDCAMAFWGAPIDNTRHAVFAVKAAISAQQAIKELNAHRARENVQRGQENERRRQEGKEPRPFLPLLSFGTGINTGFAIVGLMGSEDHILNYTVFGRDVNLASRLEAVSGRGRIIIGEETYRELQKEAPEIASSCKELEPVKVKGFRNSVPVYEVPWDHETEVIVAYHHLWGNDQLIQKEGI